MNPTYDFHDRVAVITGAGSGMGLATAQAFAESGAGRGNVAGYYRRRLWERARKPLCDQHPRRGVPRQLGGTRGQPGGRGGRDRLRERRIRGRGLRHPALGGRGAARRGPESSRFRLHRFVRERLFREPRYESAGDRPMTLPRVALFCDLRLALVQSDLHLRDAAGSRKWHHLLP
jgi:hypothetical protein